MKTPIFRLPLWWGILGGLYVLALANQAINDAENHERWEGTSLHGPTRIKVLKGSFEHSALAGLEQATYFFAGTIGIIGIPSVIGMVVYAVMKRFPEVRGIPVGFLAILIIQLALNIVLYL